MKIQFITPPGFDYFSVDSKDSPVPRIGEKVTVKKWFSNASRFAWIDLKVVETIFDYDENCINIELKEEN